jgi:hypothetical protein
MLGVSREILSISLPTLIKAAIGEGPPGEWKMLKEHPLFFSPLVELHGKLVAVGGSHDNILRRGTRFITYYDFAANIWVECTGAQLPAPLYKSGVVKIADNKVMIIGGQPEMQKFSDQIYIGKDV